MLITYANKPHTSCMQLLTYLKYSLRNQHKEILLFYIFFVLTKPSKPNVYFIPYISVWTSPILTVPILNVANGYWMLMLFITYHC